MRTNWIQKSIDILRGKKKFRLTLEDNLNYKLKSEWEKNTKEQIKKLKEKVKNKEKIKVAFLIMYSTSSQLYSLFEKMLDSSIFEPFIIINPDVSRSRENFEFNYNRSKKEMTEKYGKDKVFDGYDFKADLYKDFTGEFDMMLTNNPYDHMAHDYFRISYWHSKNIPICYISYFYLGRCYYTIENLKMPVFNMFWKFFAENNYVKKLAKKYQTIKGVNVVVTGYPKLDEIAKTKEEKRERKKIILAPHHSINMDFLAGFMEYYNTILELPKKYPNIDFVFRPHPLLIQNLKKEEFWGEEKTNEYLEKLLSYQNVTYSTEGDYYKLFVNSDGLIHDCNSFMAEYLCTKHPCAFYIRKNMPIDKIFTKFGKECLKYHYNLKNQNDIIDFIDNIIVNNNDFMKNSRVNFARKNIMMNYPNNSIKIFENIKNSICAVGARERERERERESKSPLFKYILYERYCCIA